MHPRKILSWNIYVDILCERCKFVKLVNTGCDRLQGADRPWPDKQWALCIFDDLVEHAGPVRCAFSSFLNHL